MSHAYRIIKELTDNVNKKDKQIAELEEIIIDQGKTLHLYHSRESLPIRDLEKEIKLLLTPDVLFDLYDDKGAAK